MYRVVKAELYKIFNSISTYVYIAILLAFCILSMTIVPIELGGYKTVLDAIHGGLQNLDIILIIFVVSAAMHDYTNKTSKNIICSGINRKKIYFGRQIAYSIMGVALLFISILTLGITASIRLKSGIPFTASAMGSLFGSLLLQTVMTLVIVSLCTFFGTILRNHTLSIFIPLAIVEFFGPALGFLDAFTGLHLQEYSISNVLTAIQNMQLSVRFFWDFTVVFFIFGVLLAVAGKEIYKRKQF